MPKKKVRRLVKLDVDEVSLVESPANVGSKVTLFKASQPVDKENDMTKQEQAEEQAEERLLDAKLGRMVNPDMLFYKLPGFADMPEIVPVAMTVANGKNNAGMMGLGEPPAIPTAAAIANAVANATGARVREIPITPERVLAALDRKGG